MYLIRPYVELWKPNSFSYEDGLRFIEKCGRICYTENTEVLTNKGFKYFKDLDNKEDMVLTYNQELNILEYEKPNSFEKDYSGNIIVVDHSNIKFAVTPNHRILQSVPGNRNYKFIEAYQMIDGVPKTRQNSFRIPKWFNGAYLHNSDYTGILHKQIMLNRGNHKDYSDSIDIPITDDFIILMGAYISEGHTFHGEKHGTGSYCQITQSEDRELYKLTIKALDNLGIKYRVDCDSRKPYIKWIRFGRQVYVALFEELFGRYSKNIHLPEWFRKLSVRQLKLLLKVLYLGDGSHAVNRHNFYCSISKKLLEQVQEIFIITGSNATATISNKNPHTEENTVDSWIVKRKHITKKQYNGKVYCTQTKNGIICIRYKEKTCWCGNCYLSGDKITSDSYKKFVGNIIKSGHYSVTEHYTVYLEIPVGSVAYDGEYLGKIEVVNFFKHNHYSKVKQVSYNIVAETPEKYKEFVSNYGPTTVYYITTNYRVLLEAGTLSWYKKSLTDIFQDFISEPSKHEKRYTFHVVTSIAISREFNRHRSLSVSEQSTRYCNYTKDKFNREITYIIPSSLNISEGKYTEEGIVLQPGHTLTVKDEYPEIKAWLQGLQTAEDSYIEEIKYGWKPQQARGTLPLDTRTEVIYTGFESDWKHFIDLRTDSRAHPDAQYLAKQINEKIFS